MKYYSTRGNSFVDSTSEALLKGLADDGGLFIPEEIRKVNFTDEEIERLDYTEFVYKVISAIFDDLDGEKLKIEIEKAYSKFPKDILPIKNVGNLYFMELFHGETRAFKDFALSLLPRLIKIAKEENNIEEKTLILTATSGDTGSAAISGFSGVDNTNIIVFYPTDGISLIQRAQMINSGSKNATAVAIDGNFDDAQSALKKIFNDLEFKKELREAGHILTSANSINIGRLVPQIAYYFYSYYKLVKEGIIENGEKISVAVPTGNFGNILAAYFSKLMGLSIEDFICASNKNNILEDFIKTGVYDTNREFYKTNSPSMDILVSSNLERYLSLKSGDSNEIYSLMKNLNETGKFEYKNDLEMFGFSCEEEETLKVIDKIYRKSGYVIDTHTAVAVKAAEKYLDGKDKKILIAATASPVKFAMEISKAIGLDVDDEAKAIEEVAKLSNDVEFLEKVNTDSMQELVIDKEDIKEFVRERIMC
ncbi:threonine synthase [Peptoniphilus indolicus]|uniref:Threonine synthase n=1 Tax=Peptoniphilus indolicus TaxID=33030 RepID=A0A379DEK0_9FIRM|nr:threonine synthase [Peptoniphilus indolicus]SUB75985.1 Threonine synthase [Peptoniphilus indolicus]